MKNTPGFARHVRIWALGAAALATLLCVASPGVPAQERQRPSASALEAQAHRRINAHRRAKGLPPLEYDARIAAAARRHSEAMAAGKVRMGHEGFEARGNRIAEAIPLKAMAENVGFNTYPVDRAVPEAVSGWLASPGHRENIEGDYDLTGIGVARGPRGAWYYTQIFVKRSSPRSNSLRNPTIGTAAPQRSTRSTRRSPNPGTIRGVRAGALTAPESEGAQTV